MLNYYRRQMLFFVRSMMCQSLVQLSQDRGILRLVQRLVSLDITALDIMGMVS